MFGLYASPDGRGVERRVLTFGPASDGESVPGSLEDFMEVRVYRSRGRRRVIPEVNEYQITGMQGSVSGSKKMAPVYRGDGIE